MSSFTISDNDLDQVKDQVVLITGASSGIGLATVRRIINHGGKVYAGDLNSLPEPEAASVSFSKVDVTDWKQQVELFKAAEKQYGKIDHVFANAGIAPTVSLLEDDVDVNGDLLPPDLKTINQQPTKHTVLSLMRSLTGHLHPNLPIRINAIAPSWTDTGILSPAVLAAIDEGSYQSADVPARSITVLMADKTRHGTLVYSERGHFKDLENGEKRYHHLTVKMLGVENEEDLGELRVMRDLARMAAAEKLDSYNALVLVPLPGYDFFQPAHQMAGLRRAASSAATTPQLH
ncbi:NAD(P)-binding protein [Didymella exigua CBS 183.55]|uniref:NAD(P)-binding protein n=1 Tax=Didymella exigua CBS 183.55 TaxID=1150837 RepID=A0A6A5RR01_9PLEO|nr:NAD(P)-binding protein [Didymella exigua CBS 183.55]KAF1930192.1 NAD(P)-binding protein [Didymella exigua CBS 183.55]